MPPWMPPLILLADHNGDATAWLDAAYAKFSSDFCGERPAYDGRRMGLKRHPVVDGREATFWHLISSGDVEAERLPDPRRLERIGWPKAVIDHRNDPAVKQWTEDRRGAQRIHLWCEDAMYLVILESRPEFVLPWTAYPIEYANQARRLNERHTAHIP